MGSTAMDARGFSFQKGLVNGEGIGSCLIVSHADNARHVQARSNISSDTKVFAQRG